MSDDERDKFCACGHLVEWLEPDPDPDTSSIFYKINEENGWPHLGLHEDVIERPCPHRNGTVIQHCPNCDAKVGMWGCGVAGGMECSCWDDGVTRWQRLRWRLSELMERFRLRRGND